jgi:hypothetical protein
MQLILFALAFLASFLFYKLYAYFSPCLPKIKISRFEFFPSIRIEISGRIIHLHHWFNFLIFLTVAIIVNEGVVASIATKGLLTGGIAQGLLHPDRKLIKK